MPVYVDKARLPYRRMKMSHLIADSLEELHAMADQVGLRREWFQFSGSCPHYDLCWSKRQQAVRLGAIPLDRAEYVQVMRRVRPVLLGQMGANG